eukprot:COSAG06_NODE_16828_length_978_cov_1.440273_2_plen_145_part_00
MCASVLCDQTASVLCTCTVRSTRASASVVFVCDRLSVKKRCFFSVFVGWFYGGRSFRRQRSSDAGARSLLLLPDKTNACRSEPCIIRTLTTAWGWLGGWVLNATTPRLRDGSERVHAGEFSLWCHVSYTSVINARARWPEIMPC